MCVWGLVHNLPMCVSNLTDWGRVSMNGCPFTFLSSRFLLPLQVFSFLLRWWTLSVRLSVHPYVIRSTGFKMIKCVRVGAAVIAEGTTSVCSRNACNQWNRLPAKHSRTDVADLVSCARKRRKGNIWESFASLETTNQRINVTHAHLLLYMNV